MIFQVHVKQVVYLQLILVEGMSEQHQVHCKRLGKSNGRNNILYQVKTPGNGNKEAKAVQVDFKS